MGVIGGTTYEAKQSGQVDNFKFIANIEFIVRNRSR